jgi:hypothetical protein
MAARASSSPARPVLQWADSASPGSVDRASSCSRIRAEAGASRLASSSLLGQLSPAARRHCISPTSRHHGLVCCRGAVAPGRRAVRCRRRGPAAAVSDPANVSTTARLEAHPRASGDESLGSRRGRVPQKERTPEEYGPIRRGNPNVGAQTLQRMQLFAARSLLQHDADKWACNRKVCYTPISAPNRRTRKARDLQAFRIAGAGFEPATFGL